MRIRQMEKIVEFVGEGLLGILGAVLIYEVYTSFLMPGGVIYDAVILFMDGICGA
jgi:hypothetical protein